MPPRPSPPSLFLLAHFHFVPPRRQPPRSTLFLPVSAILCAATGGAAVNTVDVALDARLARFTGSRAGHPRPGGSSMNSSPVGLFRTFRPPRKYPRLVAGSHVGRFVPVTTPRSFTFSPFSAESTIQGPFGSREWEITSTPSCPPLFPSRWRLSSSHGDASPVPSHSRQIIERAGGEAVVR